MHLARERMDSKIFKSKEEQQMLYNLRNELEEQEQVE
jgi:hypothetical protein